MNVDVMVPLTNSEKIGLICTKYCQMAEKYRDIFSSAISYSFIWQYFSYEYYYFTVFCLNKYSLGELKSLI